MVITARYAGVLVLYGRRVAWLANKNVTICSQYKHLYKIEKGCIIYIVAAVALQAQVLCVRGASAQSCGLVGTCQSLTGAFFAIGVNLRRRRRSHWGSFTKFIMQEVRGLCYN